MTCIYVCVQEKYRNRSSARARGNTHTFFDSNKLKKKTILLSLYLVPGTVQYQSSTTVAHECTRRLATVVVCSRIAPVL